MAGDVGKFFIVHDHPLYKKKIYRFFRSMEEALSYKREVESAFSVEVPLPEMKLWQLAMLFKTDRPASLLLKYRISYFLEFLETFGGFSPREVSEAAVNLWTQQYALERGHSKETVRSDKTFLNYFFRYLVEKGLLEKTPIKGECDPKKCILSKSDVSAILLETKRLSPGHLYPMALLAVEAKAKTYEIFSLKWKFLNFRRGTVFFERSGYMETHKMSEELFAAIRSIPCDSLLVFISQTGRPIDNPTFFQTRARFQKKSTYKARWTLDALRSTT